MDTTTTKACTWCGLEKPLTEYSPHARAPLGVQPRCRACCAELSRERYAADPERSRERSRLSNAKWVADNPERAAERKRAWAEENPEKMRASKRKWAEANREQKRAQTDAWRKANLVRFNEAAKAWKRRNPAAMLKYRLRKYGLTPETYEALLRAQEHRCAICDDTLLESSKYGACVDHDHDTGAHRGILCIRCNAGIGSFKEDPARLLAAERYIQLWRRKRLKVGP
jgi:hypothetical protein